MRTSPPVKSNEAETQPAAADSSEQPSIQRSGRRAALALTDQLVVSGSNFLTLAIVANSCSTADVGLFHLAWTLVGFIRTAQERALAAPYLAFVHRDDQSSNTLLGSSLAHQVGFSVVCSLGILLFSYVALDIDKLAALAPITSVLVFSIPFMLLRDHIRAVCSAHFQYHVALAMDIMVTCLQVGGILSLALLGWLTIPRVALVLGIACLLPGVGWWLLRPQPFLMRWSSILRDWRQNWSYAKWLVLSRSIAIAGNNTIPFLVLFMMDESSAGGFGTCTGLVGLSLTFIMGTNNFFQPRTIKAYYEQGLDQMIRTVWETIVVLGSILLLVVILFAFAGNTLLGLIYGPAYAGLGLVTVLLSLSMLTVSVSIACGNGLAALGQPKGYFAGEVAYCVLSIALAVLLIPKWGLLGAAFALVVGGLAASTVTASVLWRFVCEERRASENP